MRAGQIVHSSLNMPCLKAGRVLCVVLASAATVLQIGCDTGQQRLRHGPAELEHNTVSQAKAIGTTLCDTSDLAIPADLAVVGQYLVVIDIASDSVLHFIDRRTGTYRGQFGRRGEGPGEFKTPWSLDHYGDEDSGSWIYDIGLRRLTQVDIRRSLATGHLIPTQMVGLTGSGIPTGPLWVDSAIVSLGFFTHGRIVVFNAHGQPVSAMGPVPPGTDDLPPSVAQQVYQGTLVRHPDRQYLAAVTRHASLIEIYDMHGVRTVTNGPLLITPRYGIRKSLSQPSMRTGSDLRFGYVDATASRQHIYALFSGRTREGFPGRAHLGSYVHIFDWSGNFEHALSLDSEIAAIAIDVDSNILYALRHNPTPAVLAYNLSGLPGDSPAN